MSTIKFVLAGEIDGLSKHETDSLIWAFGAKRVASVRDANLVISGNEKDRTGEVDTTRLRILEMAEKYGVKVMSGAEFKNRVEQVAESLGMSLEEMKAAIRRKDERDRREQDAVFRSVETTKSAMSLSIS